MLVVFYVVFVIQVFVVWKVDPTAIWTQVILHLHNAIVELKHLEFLEFHYKFDYV